MRTRRWVLVAALCCAAAATARADGENDHEAQARVHRDRAVAAYAQHQYADAAREYEQTFALKEDPVLLYDAAQSSRMAGQKEQALTLYRKYLRRFGHRAGNRKQVLRQIARLRQAIALDRRVQHAKPTAVVPVLSLPPGEPVLPVAPPAPPPPEAAAVATTPTVTASLRDVPVAAADPAPATAPTAAQPLPAPVKLGPPEPVSSTSRADLTAAPPEHHRRRWVVPVIIAGAVVVAAAVTVGVVLGTRGASNPTPSFGVAQVQ